MPEKHAQGPDFLMSSSPYILQLLKIKVYCAVIHGSKCWKSYLIMTIVPRYWAKSHYQLFVKLFYMHSLAKFTFHNRFLKHGATHGQRASSAIQTSHANDGNFKNPSNNSMIINMSTSCFDDGAKSPWSAVHWLSCERLCDVLLFTVHAAWNAVVFIGKNSYLLYVLIEPIVRS